MLDHTMEKPFAQIVSAVSDKRGLPKEAATGVQDAFAALVLDCFVEQAMPSSLPVPTAPIFAKLTVNRLI